MTKSREDIIENIQQLLNMTTDKGCTEGEAANALAFAQALLEKHNLTMDEVTTGEGPGEPTIIQDSYNILGRFMWRKYLVNYLCRRNFCRCIFSWQRDVVHIVGRPANVAAVKEMVSWILPQLERLGRQATRKYTVGIDGWESKQRYRNSFFWGATQRINNRLYEAREERMATDANTKALVVARDTEVDNWMKDNYSTEKHHAAGAQSSKGYSDGQKAGDKVGLYGSSRQVGNGPLRLKGGN